MPRKQSWRFTLMSLAVAWLAAGPAVAQSTGRVTGKVLDAGGGVLPGVTVTVIHQGTGAARATVTAPDGTYTAADLAAGPYTVTADIQGFRRGIQKDVQVTAGAPATVDFTLAAGLSEEITVTGTRVKGRTATDTPAPVDIIDSKAIASVGTTETGKILQLLEPSVNFSTTYISDGTDIIRPVTLRA